MAASTLLAAPTLSAPSNTATGVSTTGAFSWNSVSGANGYWLTLATPPATLSPYTTLFRSNGACAISTTVPSGTSYTPTTGQLSAGVTYYWQVQAFNNSTSTIGSAHY